MMTRTVSAVITVAFLASSLVPARADNQMGYNLLSPQEAAGLPHNRGSLGMDVERAQQLTSGGMTFDIIGIKQVRAGSPGAKVGFKPGDEIIAVNGRVFPSIATFAAFVGSNPPGTSVTVDYIPAGGGPGQAQRVAVDVGAPGGASVPPSPSQQPSTGLSTGTKIAIGVGAAALIGCYEMGCFHRAKPAVTAPRPNTQQTPHMGQPQSQ